MTPFGSGSEAVTAEFRAVHNVIVNQSGDMDEFHNGTDFQKIVVGASKMIAGLGVGAKDSESGAKAFALVAGDIADAGGDARIKDIALFFDQYLETRDSRNQWSQDVCWRIGVGRGCRHGFNIA